MIDLSKELSGRFQVFDSVSQNPTGAGFAVQLSLPETLTYFKGHFPGFSVLPAMGLVDLSQFFVAQKVGQNRLRQIKRAKIKRPVGPNQNLHIAVQIQSPEGAATLTECSAVWSDPADNSVIAEIQFAVTF